jgi:hypothetical protein
MPSGCDRRISEQIDNGCARRHLMQYRLRLTRICTLQAEVREQQKVLGVSSREPRISYVSLLRWWRSESGTVHRPITFGSSHRNQLMEKIV